MPVYEMSCPKCGKRAAEYAEDKWQCLSCQHKFIYKSENVVHHHHTTVNIETAPLVDLEPLDPSNERPYVQPYRQRHPASEDAEIQNLGKKQEWCNGIEVVLAITLPIPLILLISLSYNDECSWLWTFVGFAMVATIFISLFILYYRLGAKKKARKEALSTLTETVGWMALCPYCKAEHSKYFINGKTPEPAPVHCASCGKQFMLVNGHAFKIKKEKLTTNVQPFVVPIVAPAIAAEPRILPTNSACPACGKGIPTNSIFPGLNSCPHCQAEYEAEG